MNLTLETYNTNHFETSTLLENSYIKDSQSDFLNYISNTVEPIIYSLLISEDLSTDIMTPAEKIIRDLFVKNFEATSTWFNEFYIKNYTADKVLINLLKILGNLEEYIVKKFGIVIALSSFTNKNLEVREMGLRAFENWGSIDSLTVLKRQELSPKWLDDYRIDIIKDIEEELCLS